MTDTGPGTRCDVLRAGRVGIDIYPPRTGAVLEPGLRLTHARLACARPLKAVSAKRRACSTPGSSTAVIEQMLGGA